MLELTLRVGATDLEDVLDAVLPALPGGAHLHEGGAEVELAILATADAPSEEELRRLAGPRLIELRAAEVSDDWRERRLARYEPLVVADRIAVRPEWAPPAAAPGLIEVALTESPAFGSGLHPTTQSCLAALAENEPAGSLADYGCGNGVLSIAAAQIGWSPVLAIDVDETSLAAVRENAARNGVEVDVRQLDLRSEQPPPTDAAVVNVPPAVHVDLTAVLERAPALVIASGFGPDDLERVASAWGAHGLDVVEEQRVMEWSLVVMR